MICKYCGSGNVDLAVFCGTCGKRIDGMTVCSSCGKVSPDGNFCIFCGTLLADRKKCDKCGTVYEGDSCPVCADMKDEIVFDDDIDLEILDMPENSDIELLEDETPKMASLNPKEYAEEIGKYSVFKRFTALEEKNPSNVNIFRKNVSYGGTISYIYSAAQRENKFAWMHVRKSDLDAWVRSGYFLIPHATKEKFAVWFVYNSNINLGENKFRHRSRKIIVNEDTVVEVDSRSVSENIDPYKEGLDRLVFIKNRSEDSYSNYGDYVYHGVFHLTFIYKDDKTGILTREFTRIPEYDSYIGRIQYGKEYERCPNCGTELSTEIVNESEKEKIIIQRCSNCNVKHVEILYRSRL